MSSPVHTIVNRGLRFASFFLSIALFVIILIPLGKVMASSPNAVEAVSFSKIFTPSIIGPGSTTTLSFSIINPDPVALTRLAFTDTLPAGVVIATPANATATCDSTLSVPDGGSTISFSADRLGEYDSCIITVDVTSSDVGVYTNVSGQLTSDAGEHGNATADLNVVTILPGFSKNFEPNSILLGGRSALIFTIDNRANDSNSLNLDFEDNLPVGMMIAEPANASTDCGTDVLPPNLTAVPGTSSIILDANGTFAFPAVASGATCTVSVDVTATGVGLLGNTTEELLSDFVPSGKASAVLEVVRDDLHLSKSFTDDPVHPGGTTTLAFTVNNFDRAEDALEIIFMDDLEATLTGLAPNGPLPDNPCGPGSQLDFSGGVLSLLGGNLPMEGSCTFSTTLQVPADAVAGAYPNTTSAITGTVNAETVTGSPANDILFVSPVPLLTKSFTNDPVSPGDNVTLAFTITNTSITSAATEIEFIDELTYNGSSTGFVLPFPVNVTLPPVPDPPCGVGSSLALIYIDTDRQGLELTGGSLDAGATCTFEVAIAIPATMPPGQYTNVSEAIYGTVDGIAYLGSSASDDLVVVAAPALTKTFIDDPVQPGDTVTLEFNLSHHENSPGDATAISFTDDLTFLAGLTATDLPKNVCGGTLSGTTNLSFSGGTLAAGETCTFMANLQVPADAPTGDYTNTTSGVTASVAGATVTAMAASDVLNIPGLVFTKEFLDDPVIPGDTVELEFEIVNTSTVYTATTIHFQDALDGVLSGLEAIDLPKNDVCGSGSQIAGTTSLTFQGGTLNPGASCTFTATLRVPLGAASGTYNNVTDFFYANIDGSLVFLENAADELTVQSDWLLFAKSFTDDPVPPGDPVTLEFVITNTHPISTVTSIKFIDDLGATLTGLTPSLPPTPDPPCGAGSSLSFVAGVLSLSEGNLAPGASCTFSVTLDVPADAPFGDYANTTSAVTGLINGLDVDGTPASDDLRVSYMSFDKAFSGSVLPGDAVTLTFTIANPDPVNLAPQITFSDDLDAVLPGLVAVGLPVYDVCGSNSRLSVTATNILEFSAGSLEPDSSCTFSVTLQVPAGVAPGSYLNTTSDLTRDSAVASHPATAELIIDPFVSIADLTVDEGVGSADFTLSLNGAISQDVSVNYVTSDGSALAGSDYTLTSDTATILKGAISTTVSIPITDDSLDENTETFTVTLSSPINAVISDGEGVGTITDNDDPPTLSVNDVTVDEGAGTMTFTVLLSAASSFDVSVVYATADDTAQAGVDYTSKPATTLNLSAGTVSKTLTISILEDTLDESNETFTVILSSPVNATITDGEGVGTIADNDDPPTLSVNDVTVDEDAGTATFMVTLSALSGLDVAVDFATVDDTALAGLDYTGIATTKMGLPAGTISNTISVTILEDTLDEEDETFTVALSSPVNATISDGEGVGTILNNDFYLYLPVIFKNYPGEIVIYENDFDSGAGDEWSDPIVDLTPSGESFLGQFATDAITLTLTDLPAHNGVRISFDLYVIRSWDGNDVDYGPDIWALSLDENSLLQTTFSNWTNAVQAYPGSYPGGNYLARTGAAAFNSLGYFWEGYPQDATYRLSFEIDHTSADLEAAFSSAIQVIADESWGVDNIEIILLP